MRSSRLFTAASIGLVLVTIAAAPAEARRGGSFGSRGARTYEAPPPTRTAPVAAAPIQRSMTPPAARTAPADAASPASRAPATGAQAGPAPARGGLFGGLGAGLLGGLVAGGLIGALLGNGFGGLGAGLLNTLLQLAILGLGVWLVLSLLRRRNAAQPAVATAAFRAPAATSAPTTSQGASGASAQFQRTGASSGGAQSAVPEADGVAMPLIQADREEFERLLGEVQAAFSREDYAALRSLTTPEVMSYLAEELSQNATAGRRNEVRDVRLLQADVAEAWREGETSYATCALSYESIDVMRDRTTGSVLQGDPDQPTRTLEHWTFVRRPGEPWKLSAIQ